MNWLSFARRARATMVSALFLFTVILGSTSASSQTATSAAASFSSGYASNDGAAWAHSSSSDSGMERNAGDPGEGTLPAAPEPEGASGAAAGFDHYAVAPAGYWHQRPISRMGFGADVSLLGVGFKSALELTQNFDVRVLGNYFDDSNIHFEVEGFKAQSDLHFASVSTSLDWYPFWNGSIFRISPGVMFYNQNGLSGSTTVQGGTDFKLGSTTYYSANANPATGAVPLTGTGGLALHRNNPAPMITAGFGSFVPRSNRHWSFPSEFGVIFTGAPAVRLNVAGWACLDKAQTQCTNVGDPTNPIAIEFNQNLQGRIQHWQAQANKFTIYPVFSYSVMYSFDIPGRRP